MEATTLQPRVYRDIPPDALLNGILACGGVQEYRLYSEQMERAQQRQMAALSAAAGLDIRVNQPFPDNAHEVIEDAVTRIATKPNAVMNAMMSAGLTTPLPNWWGIPSLRRQRLGQAGRAHRSMVPDSRGERFVLQQDGVSWPIFCTWADFSFDARTIAIGQRMGTPLDVSHSEWATFLVQEANEDQIINGLTDEQGNEMTIDGMTAPGLLDSTVTFTYATWTGLSGADILDVVQTEIEVLRLTHPGMPFTLLVPSNYSKKITSDYSAQYTGTVLERLQKLGPWGGRNLEVIITDTLPNNRVVLAAMDKRVMDLVVGQQPVPISWKDGSGFNTYWVVLDCVIFRMFADKNGAYGVAVGNLA